MRPSSDEKRTFIGAVPPPSSKEPGVYRYRNAETGEVYIGSTVNGYGRFIQHTSALARGDHVNKRFQRSYDESPYFEVEFISVPPDRQHEEPLKVVREIEQHLIDTFPDRSKLLNIARDVVACGGGISPSPETRAKISATLKGRVVSEETRQRTSEALKGRPLSAERRAKISDARPGNAVSVKGVIYKNAGAAAEAVGLGSKQAVRRRCLSDRFPDHFYVDQLGNAPVL